MKENSWQFRLLYFWLRHLAKYVHLHGQAGAINCGANHPQLDHYNYEDQLSWYITRIRT